MSGARLSLSRRWWLVGAGVLALLAQITGVASAQDAAAPSAAPPAPFTAGWDEGFVLQSASGDYRLVFGMVAQIDGRFALDDPLPITNTFSVRKIRPTLTGRVGRYFDFKVMPDFGGGQTVVADAYVDMRVSPAFRVRAGKDKTPVGYELLMGDAFLFLPERALASSLVPNRDIGFQAQGEVARGRILYAAGVFNGIPDGTSTATEQDTNNDKDVAGRVAVHPFRAAGNQGPLNGLGFHVGASAGGQNGALPAFRTSVGQVYFAYAPGATAAGTRTRISPAVFYYYKSLGAFAEYMRSSQEVARGADAAGVTNRAWEVTGAFVLTGEAASDRGVRPRDNFDPVRGHWGALQVLGRYAVLTVDRDVFARLLAAPGASRQARSFTLGANWYPNPWIRWYATFERTVFDDGAGPSGRPAEDVILFRAQLAF